MDRIKNKIWPTALTHPAHCVIASRKGVFYMFALTVDEKYVESFLDFMHDMGFKVESLRIETFAYYFNNQSLYNPNCFLAENDDDFITIMADLEQRILPLE